MVNDGQLMRSLSNHELRISTSRTCADKIMSPESKALGSSLWKWKLPLSYFPTTVKSFSDIIQVLSSFSFFVFVLVCSLFAGLQTNLWCARRQDSLMETC